MDEVQKARVARLIALRFDHMFRAAWHSIAEERGYKVDTFLGTASHGTIALRSYLSAKGL